MSNKKDNKNFESLEEAQKAYDELVLSAKAKEENAAKSLKEASANSEELVNEHKANAEKALETVAELSEKLDLLERNRDQGSLLVKVGKKEYKLTGTKFNLPGGGIVSAEDLSKNEDALKRLVDVGSSVLVEVK